MLKFRVAVLAKEHRVLLVLEARDTLLRISGPAKFVSAAEASAKALIREHAHEEVSMSLVPEELG